MLVCLCFCSIGGVGFCSVCVGHPYVQSVLEMIDRTDTCFFQLEPGGWARVGPGAPSHMTLDERRNMVDQGQAFSEIIICYASTDSRCEVCLFLMHMAKPWLGVLETKLGQRRSSPASYSTCPHLEARGVQLPIPDTPWDCHRTAAPLTPSQPLTDRQSGSHMDRVWVC